MKNYFLIILLSSAINSCTIDNGHLMREKEQCIRPDNIHDWRIDSCGCLGLRSLELAGSLIEENDLLNKSAEEFESVFGMPNKRKTQNNVIYLVYYLNSVCDDNNQPRKNADRCWVEFVFQDNRLIEIPQYYTIE